MAERKIKKMNEMRTNKITKSQIIIIKTLIGKLRWQAQSAAIVGSYTEGRADRVSEMHALEATELIKMLKYESGEIAAQRTPKEKMQRKILSMAHELHWELQGGKVDITRVDAWCIKYGYLHKPLKDYSVAELPTLVSAFELMRNDFLNKI